MIASLRGTILEKGPGHCVIEVGGVGYHVLLSVRTARSLPDPGDATVLLTHQVVREDLQQLFGFAASDERRLFELLITVSGIGPKVAIAVLSGLDPAALTRAIRDENIAQLVSVPGVGRKTAERIVIDLRDKIDLTIAATSAPTPAVPGVLPGGGLLDDAVAALTRLGYSPAQSIEAARRVSSADPGAGLEAIVRGALGLLSKATASVR